MTSSQTRLLGTENSTKVYLLFSKKSRGLEKSDSSKIETDQKLISYLNVGFQEQLIETIFYESDLFLKLQSWNVSSCLARSV